MGATMAYTHYVGYLAKACLAGKRTEQGLAAAREGLALASKGMLGRCIPELKRVEGELLLQRGELEAARSCFEQAIAVAHQGGATFFELRAKASLAALLARLVLGDLRPALRAQ
jgi:hypothetical protein